MFVQNLTLEQQGALIYLAKEVAQADGYADELQAGMVEILKQQSETGVAEREISINDLGTLFNTKLAKYSLLLELLGVALSNDEYHANEQSLIVQYASSLNVSQDELHLLEKWVEKQFTLQKEINELLA
ncbi:DNA repair protein [Avibacterium paragallinarum]|uniref:DNA repair protein n=1 Tax=Avibacterium paragallinarum TaxID=728 RepID=A0ABU7QT37_AVIPA|nr:DNA repair protein [Avibacterium paragallinarum]